jgi:hypothetical protein
MYDFNKDFNTNRIEIRVFFDTNCDQYVYTFDAKKFPTSFAKLFFMYNLIQFVEFYIIKLDLRHL